MDCKFPRPLFPSFYKIGPPKAKSTIPAEGWGLYGQVVGVNADLSEQSPGQLVNWKFDAQHRVEGETWKTAEPIVKPLLPPNKEGKVPSSHLSDPMDFPEHMQNFYLDNPVDAFGTMSGLLREHFYFGSRRLKRHERKNTVSTSRMKDFLSCLNYKRCPVTYFGKGARLCSHLLDDAIHDIPPGLLAELLHEELSLKWEQQQFNEVATGGALGYFPLTAANTFQEGCLIYPRRAALNSLKFQKVLLEVDEDKPPSLRLKNKPITFKLNGTVRQISVGRVEETAYVGVRSDYHCGAWMASHAQKPLSLEVIQTEHVATCLNVSPHIPGELLVTSESGIAYLWTVGKGLSKFREEEGNLYFNAQSSWRWCDFTAHPRVMLYTDRTGAELTDLRSKESCSHTLFRIGETPNCKSGERVIMSKHLSGVNAFHHLVTTQHSAYIMDERLPCLPMIKWEHMMVDPPMFAQVLAGSTQGRANQVILGSQCSQELMLLQYSGGNVVACHTMGTPQKLTCPRKTLKYLPAHIPHRQQKIQERLEKPAVGLASIHHDKNEECLCLLQMSEAGDLFYQTLRPYLDPVGEDVPQQTYRSVGNEELIVTDGSEPSEGPEPVVDRVDFTRSVGYDTDLSEFDLPSSNVDEDLPTLLDVQMHDGMESSFSQTFTSSSAGVVHGLANLTSPVTASREALLKWNWWLKKLFSAPKPIVKRSKCHWTVKTNGLVGCEDNQQDGLEKDRLDSLRKIIRETMARKEVLVHGVTYLRPLELPPAPDPVKPSEWDDDLSQRLSMSWEGRWRSWWDEKLGLNHEEKVAALRKKLRQKKRARAHRRIGLSESFTSSVSYQSDLDDRSGWFSATSSCGDSVASRSDVNSIAASVSTQSDVFPDPERALERGTQSSQLAGGDTAVLKIASSTKPKCPKQDYLSSLFGSLEEPLGAVEERDFSFPLASSSQVSSISFSQKDPCVVPFSQGTVSSQLRKKRSRMGF